MTFWGVMPAAGVGERFNASLPKQYVKIHGLPVIEHSLRALSAFSGLKKIVVGLAPGDKYWQRCACSDWPNIDTVAGGETRAKTVSRALNAIASAAQPEDWVIVHDAVRPALDKETLPRLAETLANEAAGGITGCIPSDALKLKNADGRRSRSLPTGSVFLAATPQMFRFGILRDAINEALARGSSFADEAEAVALSGRYVRLVATCSPNPKLTYPQDLDLLTKLLSSLAL